MPHALLAQIRSQEKIEKLRIPRRPFNAAAQLFAAPSTFDHISWKLLRPVLFFRARKRS
jgi:hypothetical protein